MGFLKTDVARETEMHFYGNNAANSTGVQIMDIAYKLVSIHNLFNLVFGFLWQALLKQFTGSLTQQTVCCYEDEYAHYDCCDRVEYGKVVAKQNSASNANGCAY